MGIDYSAYLFFGIMLPENFSELVYDEDGEQWEKLLAKKLGVECWSKEYFDQRNALDIEFAITSILGDCRVRYLALRSTFFVAGYSPIKFDLPETTTDEMSQKIKVIQEKLGIKYQEPQWILVVNVS